jgi:hypothetical protein
VRALELSDETRVRLGELRALSEKAESGDKEARRELRQVLRSSTPEVVARASDIARTGQRMLARSAAANDPLTEEALFAKLDAMKAEIAGDNPTPLETLLTERVVSLWMLTTLLEVLICAQYQRGTSEAGKRVAPSYILLQSKILDSATRRYLASIRELARVRKLEAGVPAVQVNTQVNICPDA